MSKPIVYMLCGLTGSGKTTYAKELEQQGYTRLALDEEVKKLVEEAGHTYPETYLEYEPAAKEKLEQELKSLLQQGKNVVLDYGFWKKADRDYYKKLINENGGIPKLLYFKISPEILLERLAKRNTRTDANALTVTPGMLSDFMSRFEEPTDEGEETVT